MLNEHQAHLDIYGIRNCDSCRHALKWLEARKVLFTFHDFRVDGLDEALLKSWLDSPQGPRLLNKRSTTWRKLSDEQKQAAESDLLSLLLANPTLIKRPVIADKHTILDIGFSAAVMGDFI